MKQKTTNEGKTYKRVSVEEFKRLALFPGYCDKTEQYTMRSHNTATGKKSKRINFIKLPMSFDIETTRKGENSYMYIWQVGIFTSEQWVIIGRTWEEFKELLRYINACLHNKWIICFVHNLPFEFMFLYGEFKNDIKNVFCKRQWQPLKFTIGNIEFRCSYQLSGVSLAKLGADFCQTQKLKGELDYTKERSHKTELSESELSYCENDVIVLCEYFEHVWGVLYDGDTIPLTATGVVRGLVMKKCIEEYAKRHPEQKNPRKGALKVPLEMFPSEQLYKIMMLYCFVGGSCGCPINIVGQVLAWLDSWDFTSDYPHKMLSDRYYYPAKWHLRNISTIEEVEEVAKNKCVMFIVEFDDYTATTPHAYTSIHKLMNTPDNKIVANGKVRYADKCRIMITEVDWSIIKRFYTWTGKPKIIASYVAERTTMPSYLRSVVAHFYTQKAVLKSQGKPYAHEKSVVNSAYGLIVQRLIESEIEYINGEFVEGKKRSYKEQIKGRCLWPQLGVYITAWARYELWRGIYANTKGNSTTVYYYDTDSMKGTFEGAGLDYILNYNKDIEEDNARMCDKYGYNMEVFRDLGQYDLETNKHKYERFKTLGAKRYIYTQGDKFKQTVAGLGKSAMWETWHDIDKCFDEFADNMEVVESQKMRSIRKVEPIADIIDGELMQANSCLSLVPVEFTLTIQQSYINAIADYMDTLKGKEKRR